MVDLRTRYLGLELDAPIVASASPLTGRLEMLQRLEVAGAAAVVLPSLFEEDIVTESRLIHSMLSMGVGASGEAETYLPEPLEVVTGPERHVELVREAKASVGHPGDCQRQRHVTAVGTRTRGCSSTRGRTRSK